MHMLPPPRTLQFFEGFALGSAAVDAGLGAARAALMGLAYSVTTPVGIAIGEATSGISPLRCSMPYAQTAVGTRGGVRR